MITLGIETSCDETACGIVNDELDVLANEIFEQKSYHEAYGGVVPEIAARAHLEKIYPVVSSALKKAGMEIGDVDLISYTMGPGLIGSLLVGASFAQGLSRSAGISLTGINHLEGHLAAAYLSDRNLKPPFLCLTVSGGHTELCIVRDSFIYQVIGRTRDDAVGEAFDKCGKILGLNYPSGPQISKLAAEGDRGYFDFPRGLNTRNNFDFSYSGVKTAFLRYVESTDSSLIQTNISHICASLETALVDILVKKTIGAMKKYKMDVVAVCGGVSANSYLRTAISVKAEKSGFRAVIPHLSLCTDNGAMIAGAAQIRAKENQLQGQGKVCPSLSWNN